MKSILDPSFRYTSSTQTDLRKTFARVRGELQIAAQAQAVGVSRLKVSPIRRPGGGAGAPWKRSSGRS
ncbi:MAG TPA: hypothetical protein VFK15_05700 [Burkholderiales bacterium]|jgi:hypothetical protein|nr:hypothetical protein [Burkholderiales bacterium]